MITKIIDMSESLGWNHQFQKAFTQWWLHEGFCDIKTCHIRN